VYVVLKKGKSWFRERILFTKANRRLNIGLRLKSTVEMTSLLHEFPLVWVLFLILQALWALATSSPPMASVCKVKKDCGFNWSKWLVPRCRLSIALLWAKYRYWLTWLESIPHYFERSTSVLECDSSCFICWLTARWRYAQCLRVSQSCLGLCRMIKVIKLF